MKYYLIVGEASGDLHASKLMKGIMDNDPQAEFRFWGGERMCDVGGVENMACDYRDGAIMGFFEVLKNLFKLKKRFKYCERDIMEYSPDVVILVDFSGFNLRIAKFVKRAKIKTYYYIAPKVWASRESRVKKIRKYVDELFVIFPFEVEYFAKHGIKAHYEGNPIMDEIEYSKKRVTSRDEFMSDNKLNDKPIIALLAGSRIGEIKDNLPFMSKVAERFPQYQFVVAGVSWVDKEIYNKIISNNATNLKLLTDKTYNILLHSEAAIVTSGTATLETALLGIPEIVCYSTPSLYYYIFTYIANVKYASLVNIVLDREVVVELLSKKFMTIDNAERELNAVLKGGNRRAKLEKDYQELLIEMGDSGASQRFGKLMVNLLRKTI